MGSTSLGDWGFGPLVLILNVLGSTAATYYFAARYLPDWTFVTRRTARCLLLILLSFLVLSASVLGVHLFLMPGLRTVWLSLAVASVDSRRGVCPDLWIDDGSLVPAWAWVGGACQTIRSATTATRSRVSYRRKSWRQSRLARSSDSLETSRGALLIVTQEGDGGIRLRPIEVVGAIPGRDGILAGNSSLRDLFWDRQLPFTRDDVSLLRTLKGIPEEEGRWLEELEMHLFVPVSKRKGSILWDIFATRIETLRGPFPGGRSGIS